MHHRVSSTSSSSPSHHHHHGVMDPRPDGSAQWVMDLSSGGTALPPSYFDAHSDASHATPPIAHTIESAIHSMNRLRENWPEDTQQAGHRNPVIQDVFWSQSEEEYLQALGDVPQGPAVHPLMELIEDQFLGVLGEFDWTDPNFVFPSTDPSAAHGTSTALHQSEGTTFEPVAPEEIISQRGVSDLAGEEFTFQPTGPHQTGSANAAFDIAGECGISEPAGIQETLSPEASSDLADGHGTSQPIELHETVCPQGMSDLAVGDASPEEDTPFEEETPRETDLETASFRDSLDLASRGFEGGLRFRSAEEARKGMERRGEVAFDATLPTTDKHKCVLVVMLVQAMQDTSSEGESKAVQDFRRGKWSPDSLELVCWEVLVSVNQTPIFDEVF